MVEVSPDINFRGTVMHILALLGAIIGGISIWAWRYRQAKEVGTELLDTVGRVRGAYNRHSFRKKAEASPLSSVEDPALAAAIFLSALANEDSDARHLSEPAIRGEIGRIVPITDLDEVIAYAQWAARDVHDARDVVRRFKPLWRQKLTHEERADLVAMAEVVAALGAEDHNQKLSIVTLKTALGPEQSR